MVGSFEVYNKEEQAFFNFEVLRFMCENQDTAFAPGMT